MKKRVLSILLTLAMLLSLLPAMSLTASADTLPDYASSGDGSATHPYIISTGDQLNELATAYRAGKVSGQPYFKLSDTFDNSAEGYELTTPIGTSSSNFTGVFDGNGRTVTLAIDESSDYAGMFGYVNTNGVIKNVIRICPLRPPSPWRRQRTAAMKLPIPSTARRKAVISSLPSRRRTSFPLLPFRCSGSTSAHRAL